jgi:hypothetical protein
MKLGGAGQAAYDQAQHDRTGGALAFDRRSAGQVEMRRAVDRAAKAGMAAEGDGLPVPVAAIGIAALAWREIEERDEPRADADGA